MQSLLLAFALALPCLWDRDTLALEAAGAPELVDVLVGRFDRLPPPYHELRLLRVTGEIDAGARDLALFDDAAVACERLGRSDEAIAWMARKRAALDAAPTTDAFHEYTYLANLGTFHAHRALRDGVDRAELERARKLIAAAIASNPDAHFGRERYQLLAIEELLAPTPPSPRAEPGEPVTIVTRLLGPESPPFPADRLRELGYGDAVDGLAGLIRLGGAWESPLVWASLEHALLDRGDAWLARLAARRVVELADAGAAPGPAFDRERYLEDFRATLEARHLGAIDAWWRRARAAADAWRAARTAYAAERLARGEHPDTHAGFWDEWTDVHPLPAIPAVVTTRERVDRALLAGGLAVLALVAAAVVRHRRRARARAGPEDRDSRAHEHGADGPGEASNA